MIYVYYFNFRLVINREWMGNLKYVIVLPTQALSDIQYRFKVSCFRYSVTVIFWYRSYTLYEILETVFQSEYDIKHCRIFCLFIVVFNQGDDGKSWYIILKGSVNVVIYGKVWIVMIYRQVYMLLQKCLILFFKLYIEQCFNQPLLCLLIAYMETTDYTLLLHYI